MEPHHELLISLVLDRRVEAQVAELRRLPTKPTIDDVRSIALRLRALRYAWREIAIRSRRLGSVEAGSADHRCDGGGVRVDIRVVTTEPLVDSDATSYEDARDKLEALSCVIAGDVTALEVDVYPTALRRDTRLLAVPPWPVVPREG